MWLTTQMHTAQCAYHTHTVCNLTPATYTAHTCHKHVPHTLYARSCTQHLHVRTRHLLHISAHPHAYYMRTCYLHAVRLFLICLVGWLILCCLYLCCCLRLTAFHTSDQQIMQICIPFENQSGKRALGNHFSLAFASLFSQRQHQFSAHTLPLIFREDNRMVNQPPIGSDLLVGDPSKCLSFINDPENSFAISS